MNISKRLDKLEVKQKHGLNVNENSKQFQLFSLIKLREALSNLAKEEINIIEPVKASLSNFGFANRKSTPETVGAKEKLTMKLERLQNSSELEGFANRVMEQIRVRVSSNLFNLSKEK